MYCFGLGLTLASILKSRIILTHEERSKVVEKSVYTSKQIKLRPMRKLVEFVRQFKEKPLWLDHFKYYYDTGKFVDCTPSTMDQCPVHGKKR